MIIIMFTQDMLSCSVEEAIRQSYDDSDCDEGIDIGMKIEDNNSDCYSKPSDKYVTYRVILICDISEYYSKKKANNFIDTDFKSIRKVFWMF